MENIVLDSITIVVDSLAMVAALVAIGVSLYTYYKTYDFYRYQELDNMYMRILEIGIEHEGALSGDAEYDLTAYVQGVKVGLTDKSHRGSNVAGLDIPPHGLGDVSEGETVTFDPDTEVTVEIPETLPLLIFTVGDEVDHSCRTKHPDNIWDKLITILQKPQDTWFDSVKVIQQNENLNVCTSKFNNAALMNPSDILGIITKFYDPPDYGGSSHTSVVSDTGDFILKYTITVIPPQTTEKKQTITGNNNFSSSPFNSNLGLKSIAP
jgi:hypothetical protein